MGGLIPDFVKTFCFVTLSVLVVSVTSTAETFNGLVKMVGKPAVAGVDAQIQLTCSLRFAPPWEQIYDILLYKGSTMRSNTRVGTWDIAGSTFKMGDNIDSLLPGMQVAGSIVDHADGKGHNFTMTLTGFTACAAGEYRCQTGVMPTYTGKYQQVVDTIAPESAIIVSPSAHDFEKDTADVNLSCTIPAVKPVATIQWWFRKQASEPEVAVTTTAFEVLKPLVKVTNSSTCADRVTQVLTLKQNPMRDEEYTYSCHVSGGPYAAPVVASTRVKVSYRNTAPVVQALTSCANQPVCIGPVIGVIVFGAIVTSIVGTIIYCRVKRKRNNIRTGNGGDKSKREEEMRIMNGAPENPPPGYEEEDDGCERLDHTVNTTLHTDYSDDDEEEDVKPKQKHLNVLL